jgi:hypothetical protein
MPSHRTGVLLVHGIGDQSRREFLDRVLTGLLPRIRAVARAGSTVRFYEVYWADLDREVSARERVRYNAWLMCTLWRPLLNPAARGSRRLPRLGVALLQVPVVVFGFAHWMVNVALELMTVARPGPLRAYGARWRRSLFEYAGDVALYVSPQTLGGRTRRDAILGRFDRALRLAAGECDRVHVVGHSLGSVIAYEGLAATGAGRPPVDTLVTVGSPLDKYRHFWPIRRDSASTMRTTPAWNRWVNVTDIVDPIGARLHRFPATADGPGPENRVISHRIAPTSAHNDYWEHRGLTTWLAQVLVGEERVRDLPGSPAAVPGAIGLARAILATLLGIGAFALVAMMFAAVTDFVLGVSHDYYATTRSPTVVSALRWLDSAVTWTRDWLGFHEGPGATARGLAKLLGVFGLLSFLVACADPSARAPAKPSVGSPP